MPSGPPFASLSTTTSPAPRIAVSGLRDGGGGGPTAPGWAVPLGRALPAQAPADRTGRLAWLPPGACSWAWWQRGRLGPLGTCEGCTPASAESGRAGAPGAPLPRPACSAREVPGAHTDTDYARVHDFGFFL